MVEPGILRGTQRPIRELDVLWITAGLGCDGDTIAMTAATQPSIEDILLGQIPWIPKVTLHNPFLALANGDDFIKASDFIKAFHQATEGKMENFILVVEGSIPRRAIPLATSMLYARETGERIGRMGSASRLPARMRLGEN
jgi:Ni,Fe-hydrogenase I small subunit